MLHFRSKIIPVVTHGFTFCTVIEFDSVAKAIAECAFVTSELPVSLSLEMHCSPKQQHKLAKALEAHLGSALLSVRLWVELCVCVPST